MMRQGLVEQRAKKALVDAGQWGPPVDLDEICKRNGLALHRGRRLGRQQAHYDQDRAEIAVSESRKGWAERFSIAHELGHALMEHGSQACYMGSIAIEAVPLDEADTGVDYEAEADAFADALLIPKDWLRRAVIDEELTITELREAFEATPEVMFIALKNARGLLNKVRTK